MQHNDPTGVDVNAIISGLAGANAGTGIIGGYCEDGFPLFYANQAMVDMLGYRDLDDLAKGINGMVANTIHPDDMAQVSADLGPTYYEGQTYETQYRMPRKDGTWFWTVDRGEIVRAEDGRLAIISVCTDMTDFMRRHAVLEKRSMMGESMLNGLPGGYHRCAADDGFTFLYVSPRFLDMLGWTEDEIRTKFDNKFINLVHPDDRKLTTGYVERISDDAAKNGMQDQVYRMAAKDAGYRWVTDATMELEVDGQRLYQGFITDITDYMVERENREERLRKATADAERANASKTSFLRHMSHDIRTPLNGIMGMIEMSERYDDDPKKRRECRQKMLESTNYLLSLVNNILDMNKLESGSIELENKPFDIIELLLDNLSVTDGLASEAGIELTGGREASTIKHRYLIGSPTYVNRVLMNLVSNAIKYNRPGGTVNVYATELSCANDTVLYRFVCADTGIGMSEEFQRHAFDAFAQEERAVTASLSGTGLGLPIVKELVALMGGTMHMQSAENVGTTFTVDLPFGIDRQKHAKLQSEQKAVDLSGMHALLVEDNDLNAEIAEMLLGDMGITIERAANGAEGVEMFEASQAGAFDLIFMDVMMPVMNGLDAARAIRALDRPDAQSVPILAMTANAFQDDIRASIDAGMNAHITKPLYRDRIEEAVATAMA